MAEVILRLDKVCKSFRSHWTFRPIQALRDISLEVYRGESFGFLGHNGAGKTTTMKCIFGLIHKTSGSIQLNGAELLAPEQRSVLGYLPEQPYFYDHLSVFETVDFFAALHGMPSDRRRQKVIETLERVGVADRAKSRVRTLSKGLQQRVGVAQAIINDPQLLLLDEPFSGLDPIGRLELRRLILDLKKNGTTIFLSSHILSDVEDICDRVSIMARGELKTVFHIKDSPELFGETFEVILKSEKPNPPVVKAFADVASSFETSETASGFYFTFHFNEYAQAQACVQAALQGGTRLEDFRTSGMSLEEIFMTITRGNQLASAKDGQQKPVSGHTMH